MWPYDQIQQFGQSQPGFAGGQFGPQNNWGMNGGGSPYAPAPPVNFPMNDLGTIPQIGMPMQTPSSAQTLGAMMSQQPQMPPMYAQPQRGGGTGGGLGGMLGGLGGGGGGGGGGLMGMFGGGGGGGGGLGNIMSLFGGGNGGGIMSLFGGGAGEAGFSGASGGILSGALAGGGEAAAGEGIAGLIASNPELLLLLA